MGGSNICYNICLLNNNIYIANFKRNDSMSSMNSKRGKLKPIDDDDFLKSGIESEEDINEIQFLLTTDAGT